MSYQTRNQIEQEAAKIEELMFQGKEDFTNLDAICIEAAKKGCGKAMLKVYSVAEMLGLVQNGFPPKDRLILTALGNLGEYKKKLHNRESDAYLLYSIYGTLEEADICVPLLPNHNTGLYVGLQYNQLPLMMEWAMSEEEKSEVIRTFSKYSTQEIIEENQVDYELIFNEGIDLLEGQECSRGVKVKFQENTFEILTYENKVDANLVRYQRLWSPKEFEEIREEENKELINDLIEVMKETIN